jgi:hypothetical protein
MLVVLGWHADAGHKRRADVLRPHAGFVAPAPDR